MSESLKQQSFIATVHTNQKCQGCIWLNILTSRKRLCFNNLFCLAQGLLGTQLECFLYHFYHKIRLKYAICRKVTPRYSSRTGSSSESEETLIDFVVTKNTMSFVFTIFSVQFYFLRPLFFCDHFGNTPHPLGSLEMIPLI